MNETDELLEQLIRTIDELEIQLVAIIFKAKLQPVPEATNKIKF
jgi:hypothetical protein